MTDVQEFFKNRYAIATNGSMGYSEKERWLRGLIEMGQNIDDPVVSAILTKAKIKYDEVRSQMKAAPKEQYEVSESKKISDEGKRDRTWASLDQIK